MPACSPKPNSRPRLDCTGWAHSSQPPGASCTADYVPPTPLPNCGPVAAGRGEDISPPSSVAGGGLTAYTRAVSVRRLGGDVATQRVPSHSLDVVPVVLQPLLWHREAGQQDGGKEAQ